MCAIGQEWKTKVSKILIFLRENLFPDDVILFPAIFGPLAGRGFDLHTLRKFKFSDPRYFMKQDDIPSFSGHLS